MRCLFAGIGKVHSRISSFSTDDAGVTTMAVLLAITVCLVMWRAGGVFGGEPNNIPT